MNVLAKRIFLSWSLILAVFSCLAETNPQLETFDFTTKTIGLILSRAKGGDLYYQALYEGLTTLGYESEMPNSQEERDRQNGDSQNGKAKSSGVKDDWFGVAEKKVATQASADISEKNDWIDTSAAAQNPIGLFFKAYRLENKKGIRDVVVLHDLWGLATAGLIELGKKNDPVALTFLGIIYEKSYIDNGSLSLAKSYYRKGVECNSALAAQKLCELLFKDAQSKDDYRELLKLNKSATEGAVKGADKMTVTILDSAEKKFAAKVVPFVSIWLLPGKYHFINPISKLLVRVGGLVSAVVGAVFGWFIFPYTLAPIKLLIRSPMEIYIDRIFGAIGLFFLLFAVTQAWLCNFLY